MIRDTWRAVLVVVTAALLREIALLPRPATPAATPAVATSWPAAHRQDGGWSQHPAAVAWQPQWHQPSVATAWQAAPQPQQTGPIRKVARATVDLAESVLEAIR